MVRKDKGDIIFRRILLCFPITILLIVGGIFFQLSWESFPSIQKFGLPFLFDTTWDPVFEKYGALPFIYGTLLTSFVSLLLAIPIGVGTAIYLAEYVPVKGRKIISSMVDLLAAIPSVIYGLWGIFVLVPIMRSQVQPFLGKYLGFLPFFK